MNPSQLLGEIVPQRIVSKRVHINTQKILLFEYCYYGTYYHYHHEYYLSLLQLL